MWSAFKQGLGGSVGAAIGWAVGQWLVKQARRLLLVGVVLASAWFSGSPFDSAKPASRKPSVVQKADQAAKLVLHKNTNLVAKEH